MPDPRLPDSRLWLLNPVITRGTPPRLEGCRPASRGLTLALMTNTKAILLCTLDANSGGDIVPLADLRPRPACDRALYFSAVYMQVDTCPNTLDNVAVRTLSPPKSDL